jgi:hypothetical protein
LISHLITNQEDPRLDTPDWVLDGERYSIAGYHLGASVGHGLLTTATEEKAVDFLLVYLVKQLAAQWVQSQEIEWNGWTRLECSWSVIMLYAAHGHRPEMFAMASPRLQVWWDRALAPLADRARLYTYGSIDRGYPRAPWCWARLFPYSPDGDFITTLHRGTWLKHEQGVQSGPEGTKYRRVNACLIHSPQFPVAAYLVACALTQMRL